MGALAAALLAAADPLARRARGGAAHAAVAECYALPAQTDRLLALYAALVATRPAPGAPQRPGGRGARARVPP